MTPNPEHPQSSMMGGACIYPLHQAQHQATTTPKYSPTGESCYQHPGCPWTGTHILQPASPHCIAPLWLWLEIWPISSSHASYPAYMHSPSCLPLATQCLGSPQDTCGPSGLPHMAYCLAGLLVRTPCSLSDQSFFQDSMHGGAPSEIQALIRKWVPLGHHWPGLHHMVLHPSGTWSGHLCTTICEE